MASACLALGLALVVFDALNAGIGWRYMADFGWLLSIAALPGLLRVLAEPAGDCANGNQVRLTHRLRRMLVVMAMLYALALAVLSMFTPGRYDDLIGTHPKLFHEVMSWFTL